MGLSTEIYMPFQANQIVLHVGCNQTGTTYLQNEYFDKHPGILNAGKPGFKTVAGIGEITDAIIEGDDDVFDQAVCRNAANHSVEEWSENKTCVWSDENFTANTHHIRRNAIRLKSLVGNARILITVRNQFTLVESLFIKLRQRAAVGKEQNIPKTIDEWVSRELAVLESGGASVLGRLDLWEVVSVYQDVFGKDALRVQCLEVLKFDRQRYVEDMSEWLGVDPTWMPAKDGDNAVKSRVRITHRREALLPFSRNTMAKIVWSCAPGLMQSAVRAILDSGGRARAHLSDDTRRRLEKAFKSGNGQLESSFNLNLGAYGYPL